jgi:hypothetical protein
MKPKAVVTSGWHKLVMDLDDAITFATLLAKAETWEEKWVSSSDSPTGESFTKFHVYPSNTEPTLTVITEEKYNVAKLAGKPEK